jgi:hypothetical protein
MSMTEMHGVLLLVLGHSIPAPLLGRMTRSNSGCDHGEQDGEVWAMELEAVADHAATITHYSC